MTRRSITTDDAKILLENGIINPFNSQSCLKGPCFYAQKSACDCARKVNVVQRRFRF